VPLTCDAIIFDLDGVLVDSNNITERHLRAWTARHNVSFEHIASLHHGRTTVETIRLVAPHLDAKVEACLLEGAESVDTNGLAAFAGADRLLAGLPRERWAIATSGTRQTATVRLAHVGLPLPRVLVTADDVASGKPSPEPYLLAAKRLGLDPTRCVVVEDAPAGITSARAAGARVIGVISTNSADNLAEADIIVGCLADLSAIAENGTLVVSWGAPAI
jgi:mannitol-1-/sugar-/sorbitol-6-phosphatase